MGAVDSRPRLHNHRPERRVNDGIDFHAETPAPFTVRRLTRGDRTYRLASAGHGTPGTVCVIRLGDGYLIGRHWRPVDGKEHWEFPRGMGQPGETPEQTAARECLEETGAVAGSIVELGRIHADSGALDDDVRVMLMDVARWERATDDELSGSRFLLASEIDMLIALGEVDDSPTLAAWMLARLRA